jgi:hypothetical protein
MFWPSLDGCYHVTHAAAKVRPEGDTMMARTSTEPPKLPSTATGSVSRSGVDAPPPPPKSIKVRVSSKAQGSVARAYFGDMDGHGCSIQEHTPHGSKAACIFLGPEAPKVGYTRMRLSREQVAELLPVLQAFVATGSIVDPGDGVLA